MPRPPSTFRALAVLLFSAATSAAVTPAGRWHSAPVAVATPSQLEGRVLILPGVGNTSFHLAGFVASTEAQLPRFDAEVRTCGFATEDERLLQYHCSTADEPFGHAGNHLAYLNAGWQAAKLLPALDPAIGPEGLTRQWAHTCKES